MIPNRHIFKLTTRLFKAGSSFFCLLLIAVRSHGEVTLPKIIGKHMVLQRGAEAPIWGNATPGEQITVRGQWSKRAQTTRAGKHGKWSVQLPLPKSAGPHVITIRGENEIILRDVLIGEVWVCSGQSNMEMPVGHVAPGYEGAVDWQEELKRADALTDIRFFTVPNRHSLSPQSDCEGEWVICNSETARTFSAAGFFFGRELHQKLKRPVGLISADYGGTVAEAWASEKTISRFPDFTNQLAAISNERDHAVENAAARSAAFANWLREIESADDGSASANPDLDDSSWETVSKLEPWRGILAQFDGFVWLRKAINLTDDWTNRVSVLELGTIDDMDFTYINGVKIGQTAGEQTWNAPRKYRVPNGLLKPGTNLIAIRVLDTGGEGGITGPARLLSEDGAAEIALNHNWQIKAGTRLTDLSRLNLGNSVSPNTATVLFNGMIAPIIPFGIRGVIWYQGESNIGRDEQYRRLFPALIADWRQQWGCGNFPFYFTQIAPFRYPNPGMAAALRDAQRFSLKTPNTGMAVTMDSDSNNLHPHTKQSVGHRLALWALAKTYGRKNIVYSGPLYRKMKVEGNQVRIYFDHVGSGLTSNGKPLEHFEIAAADGRFVSAHARINGDTILVFNESVRNPVAVRYAWGDADESSFGNNEGLPASSFRTDAIKR